ncbi:MULTISPECIES: xanthine dehydrogenase family protein subunit M [unclassified Pedobacter]|uniref:FAD binding domain-containing protein n=1 Tax=unclassified Pedobacter TaxID=2628915 RepID=UPI000B4AFFBB|nr:MULTISPECIES: xanthine dehydrogenase family protein subunit M [unclassified Pedobacter]MCX2429498.1 xanthine dehydrogenase family protein subunit M [Pedobacter sp. GR22-10]OWK70872.1 FAD-binding molybdopterin dehydrogenase [Pedobacter sp. AJM]
MNNFEYKQATNIHDALDLVNQKPDAVFIAGGTNLIDLWKYDLTHPSQLIDINHIPENDEISIQKDGKIRLGAAVKNADTAYHPLIEQKYPLLSRAILAGASAQIRNMASNGGNLLQRTRCYYFYDPDVPCNKRNPGSGCPAKAGYNRIHAILGTSDACIAVFPSDMCIALAALDATVNVSGPNGNRSIPFASFHRLPDNRPDLDNTLEQGEIITSIDLPQDDFSENYSYLKLRDRHSYAFALVSVATAFKLNGNTIELARIALGGVAHKPWRNIEAEEFLKNKEANAENFSAAADMILKGAKGFGHNDFKISLAKKAIIRNGLMALNPSSQLPGAQPSA